VNFRESNRSPFLITPADYGRMSTHSAETAREIDEEVKRILEENLSRVRHILAERRQSLEAVTKALMEQETIDSDELKRIMEETSSGARIVPGTEAEPKRPSIRPTSEETAKEKDAGAGL
jgi:cell division protease FtsH